MKTLNFAPELVGYLYPSSDLSRETGQPVKWATWRCDKELYPGEPVLLTSKKENEQRPFAGAVILETFRKPFGNLTDRDRQGHETYPDDETMLATFQQYYPHIEVGASTPVTVARLAVMTYIISTDTTDILVEPDFEGLPNDYLPYAQTHSGPIVTHPVGSYSHP